MNEYCPDGGTARPWLQYCHCGTLWNPESHTGYSGGSPKNVSVFLDKGHMPRQYWEAMPELTAHQATTNDPAVAHSVPSGCASRFIIYAATKRFSAKAHSASSHCSTHSKPVRCAICKGSSFAYL